MPAEPERSFIPISLKKIANTDFYGETVEGVMGWTDEGVNDLHEFPVGKQKFEGIEFDVIDPAKNGRKACLGISNVAGYSRESLVEFNQKARSFYFLHTANNSYYAGRITLNYEDGTFFSDEVGAGKILNWWYPTTPVSRKQMPKLKVAWRGKNEKSDRVGVCVYGLNNPYPDKIVKNIQLSCAENSTKWMILGITASDYPVHFVPGIISGGIPDNWGAAAVLYALVEGLAGIKDQGVAFDRALIAPRWEAADVDRVSTSIKYEASQGYVAYDYKMEENQLNLTFTGNDDDFDLQLLIPKDVKIKRVLLNEQEVEWQLKKVENSNYLCTQSKKRGINQLKVVF